MNCWCCKSIRSIIGFWCLNNSEWLVFIFWWWCWQLSPVTLHMKLVNLDILGVFFSDLGSSSLTSVNKGCFLPAALPLTSDLWHLCNTKHLCTLAARSSGIGFYYNMFTLMQGNTPYGCMLCKKRGHKCEMFEWGLTPNSLDSLWCLIEELQDQIRPF